jgi:hypothetical protein
MVAQWVPLSSTQTTTVQVTTAAGKTISYEQRVERYHRKSNGSVLIQQIPNDGSNTPVSAILLDQAGTHKSYKLDYVNGVAVDRHRPVDSALPRTRAFLAAARPEDRPPEETVNGIRCVVKPVSLVQPDGSLKTIGKVWLAPDYNFLLIKEDTMHPLKGGGSMHIAREVHNLAAGVEPDDALFARDAETIKRARTLSGPQSRQKP